MRRGERQGWPQLPPTRLPRWRGRQEYSPDVWTAPVTADALQRWRERWGRPLDAGKVSVAVDAFALKAMMGGPALRWRTAPGVDNDGADPAARDGGEALSQELPTRQRLHAMRERRRGEERRSLREAAERPRSFPTTEEDMRPLLLHSATVGGGSAVSEGSSSGRAPSPRWRMTLGHCRFARRQRGE